MRGKDVHRVCPASQPSAWPPVSFIFYVTQNTTQYKVQCDKLIKIKYTELIIYSSYTFMVFFVGSLTSPTPGKTSCCLKNFLDIFPYFRVWKTIKLYLWVNLLSSLLQSSLCTSLIMQPCCVGKHSGFIIQKILLFLSFSYAISFLSFGCLEQTLTSFCGWCLVFFTLILTLPPEVYTHFHRTFTL